MRKRNREGTSSPQKGLSPNKKYHRSRQLPATAQTGSQDSSVSVRSLIICESSIDHMYEQY
jgi:hypothetical protein